MTDDVPTPLGIGWHRHPDKSWVWGVCAHDGCDLCDAADKWYRAHQQAELIAQDRWEQVLAKQISIVRQVNGLVPRELPPSPHVVAPLPPKEQPSLDKIEPVKVEQKTLELLLKPANDHKLVALDEEEATRDDFIPMKPPSEPPPPPEPPKPPPPPTFKLTNPTPDTFKRRRKR